MRKRLLFLFILIIPVASFSQGYRLTVNACGNYFNKFDSENLSFYGFSGDYSFLIKRLGLNMGVNFYMPREYYGTQSFLDFNDLIDKRIRVNAKGGGFSINFGFTYDLIKSKSEKSTLTIAAGFMNYSHNAEYNKEPFIRIYGGAYNISISYFAYRLGLRYIRKVGYVPVIVSFYRCNPLGKREYDSFKTSGFYELDLGIAFPILKSPPPTEIHKIRY